LGLIENMSYALCPHCGEKLAIFGASQGEEVARDTGLEYLGSIPWDTELNNLIDQGRIEDYDNPVLLPLVDKITVQLP
jgi:hypothetical protein